MLTNYLFREAPVEAVAVEATVPFVVVVVAVVVVEEAEAALQAMWAM